MSFPWRLSSWISKTTEPQHRKWGKEEKIEGFDFNWKKKKKKKKVKKASKASSLSFFL